MKSLLERSKNWYEMMEERNSELQDRSIEIISCEEEKEKEWRKVNKASEICTTP